MNNTLNQLLAAKRHLSETKRHYTADNEDEVRVQQVRGNLELRLDRAILKQIGKLLDAVEDE